MSKNDQVKISVQQLNTLESYIEQLDLRKAKGLLYRVLHPEKTYMINREYVEYLVELLKKEDLRATKEIIRYFRLLMNQRDLRKDIYQMINDEGVNPLKDVYDDQKAEIIAIQNKLDELCQSFGATCPKEEGSED